MKINRGDFVDFREKTVIVTGGAQGIGKGICEAFADQGASVIIADIDQEAGEETQAAIQKAGGKAIFIKTDVTNENEIIHLIEQTIQFFGKIDILINNAGIGHTESIYTISSTDFDKVMNTNIRATFLCSKYAAIEMKKQQIKGGVIINIASTRALMSEAHTEAYAASKGAILSITHALAISLGEDNIRVNAISPGWIEVRDWQKTKNATLPIHSHVDREQHPVGRVGHPNDIASACLYFASENASFITGQNLIIDGGMTKKMIYSE